MLDIRTKKISYEVLLPNKLFIRSVLKSDIVNISQITYYHVLAANYYICKVEIVVKEICSPRRTLY